MEIKNYSCEVSDIELVASTDQLPLNVHFLEIHVMDWSHGLSDWVRRLGICFGIMNVVSSKRRIPCRLNLQRSRLPHKLETPCKHKLVSLHYWSTYNHKSNDIIFQRFSPHVRLTAAFVRYFLAFIFGFIKASALAVLFPQLVENIAFWLIPSSK